MTDALKIPREIHDLFVEAIACADCRDSSVAKWFNARRAIYYARQSIVINAKAWALIRELYPEVSEGKWYYDFDDRMVKRESLL